VVALKGANSRFFTECYPKPAVLLPPVNHDPEPAATGTSLEDRGGAEKIIRYQILNFSSRI
jgi:hypothetical protein